MFFNNSASKGDHSPSCYVSSGAADSESERKGIEKSQSHAELQESLGQKNDKADNKNKFELLSEEKDVESVIGIGTQTAPSTISIGPAVVEDEFGGVGVFFGRFCCDKFVFVKAV